MSLCSASGNAGFPVVLQGTIQRATIPDTSIREAKFKTSLSVRSVPRTYDAATGFIDELAGQDTFIFNSTPYLLQAVQLYDARNNTVLLPAETGAPVHEGIPAFGVALSFTKQQPNYAGEEALMVLIPIFNKGNLRAGDVHTDIDTYFKDIVERESSPQARSLGVFLNYKAFRCAYSTCVELQDGSTLNMRVVLFPGYVIDATTAASYTALPPIRIPGQLRGFKATAFRRGVDLSNVVIVSQWSDEGYCYAGLLSVGDTSFYNRFTFYNSVIEPTSSEIGRRPGMEHLRTTQQYKCMPLDKLKDISGGLVMVDPETGLRTTLADELEQDEIAMQTEVAEALPTSGEGVKGFLFRFAGAIGTIVAIVFAGFLYYVLGQRFHTTEKAIAAAAAAAASENVAAAAAAATSANQHPASVSAGNQGSVAANQRHTA